MQQGYVLKALDQYRFVRPWHVIGLILILAGVACSGDEPGIDDQINQDNNGNNGNNGQLDGGADADVATDGSEDPDTGDAGTDSDADAGAVVGQSCAAPPEDLGTFSPGDSGEFARGFHERIDDAKATCADVATRAGVYWFSFEVDEVSIAHIDVLSTAASDPLIELRETRCVSAEDVVFCTDNLSRTQVLEPGNTYYLLVQGAEDSVTGDFRLDLSFEEAACNPNQTSCSDGAIQVCQGGTELQARTCAGSCTDASTCEGDLCEEAIPVDVSTAGTPVILTGNQQAYAGEWDAAGRTGCGLEPGQSAGSTPGAELFLKLSGHTSGDTIIFDAEGGSVDFGFYVLASCGAGSCLGAGAYDDLGDNHFEWRANTSQDIYVAAEVIGPDRDANFQIQITREAR